MVQQVISAAHRRLRWATTSGQTVDVRHILECLQTDDQGALAYAETVIAWEALPAQERAHQKAVRATHYQRQSMAQFPVTPKQVSFLRALGYADALPSNRADALTVIDQLLSVRRASAGEG